MKGKRSINEQPPLQIYRRKRPKKSYVHWYVVGGIVIVLTLVGSIFAMNEDPAPTPKKQPVSVKKTPKQKPNQQKETVMVESEEDTFSLVNDPPLDPSDKSTKLTPSKETTLQQQEVNQFKKATPKKVKDQQTSSNKHFNRSPVNSGPQNGHREEQNESNGTNGNGNQNSGANHSPDPNPPSNEEPDQPTDSDHEDDRGHWWDDLFGWIRR